MEDLVADVGGRRVLYDDVQLVWLLVGDTAGEVGMNAVGEGGGRVSPRLPP